MRIAQAIALYPPEFQGGATLVCERLARELVARGHVVDVFSGRTTAGEPLGAVRRERVGDALTWRVNLGGAFLPWSREGWDGRVAADSFARFLDDARPDVVHVHGLQALGVRILGVAAAARVPVVWTMHDWWWLCPCLFRLSPQSGRPCSPIPRPERCSGRDDAVDFSARRAALDAALARVARVLVPSAYLRDSLLANGLPADVVAVQENGVEPARAAAVLPAAPDRAAQGGVLRAVFIGGAGNREKGVDVLVSAARRVRRQDVVVELHCVDPAETAHAAGGGGAATGARLEHHPRFDPGALDSVLAAADAVVVPSLMRESFSLVTREALARGVPVVTSDCGGPEEVVRHGENGLVVATGSAAALAAALERLAADRALLARLAAAPRPRQVTPAEHARAAEAVYREVVREAAPEVARAAASVSSVAAARARRSGDHATALRGRRFLFLAGIDGAPLRYRVWHLVEQLELAGASCRVLYHSHHEARRAAAAADCIVLYRAPFSAVVAGVVADARARRAPVVFSADDLVFDASACDAPALADPRPDVARGFRWTLDAYGRSFAAADAFLGSTEELVATARAAGADAYLHRNGLGRPLLSLLDGARKERIARDDAAGRGGDGRSVRIGFLSGTDTHDADLAAIAPALRGALDRCPGLRLVLGGPVAAPPEIAARADRIERLPFVPWSDLGGFLAGLDVCLAPLEPSRRFNEAKSEVKYLEAAAAGVPTIASPTGPFRAASGEGATALLAAGTAEWESAILRLAADPERRVSLARLARRDVARRYGPHAQSRELVPLFAEILARGGLAAPPPAPDPIETDGGHGSCVALEPAASAYDAYQLAADETLPLSAGTVVEQSFECRGDGVWRVDFLVATCWRRNRHAVRARVLDEDGAELGRAAIDAALAADRSHVAVELDRPLASSRGRRLRLCLEAEGAGPGNEILLWHGPSEQGELRAGGRPIAGRSLAFRSFGEEVA